MKTYRSAFFVALAGNVLLAGALGFFWWRSHATGKGWMQGLTLPSKLPQAVRSILPAALQPAETSTTPASARANFADRTGASARPDIAAAPAKHRRKARPRTAQDRIRSNQHRGQRRSGRNPTLLCPGALSRLHSESFRRRHLSIRPAGPAAIHDLQPRPRRDRARVSRREAEPEGSRAQHGPRRRCGRGLAA